MGLRSGESIRRRKGWQDSDAAFPQNSLTTCFSGCKCLSSLFLPSSYSFSFLPHVSFLPRNTPWNPCRECGERCNLSPAGPNRAPTENACLCVFSLLWIHLKAITVGVTSRCTASLGDYFCGRNCTHCSPEVGAYERNSSTERGKSENNLCIVTIPKFKYNKAIVYIRLRQRCEILDNRLVQRLQSSICPYLDL